MTAKKILIVEDEAIIAMNIKSLLQRKGYDVIGIASSAAEAIKLADECHPDLIMMDIKLSGEADGIEAFTEIRKKHHVPIVYCTSHTDAETFQRARDTEPNGFLIKPIKPEELYSTIEIARYKYEMDLKVRESEEMFRMLTENAMVGVYLIQDNKFHYVNKKHAETFGYTVEEMISSIAPIDLVLPEDRHIARERIRQREDGEIKSAYYIFRGIKKSGKIIYVEVSGTGIDYKGKPAIIGTGLDITDRIENQERLMLSGDIIEKIQVGLHIYHLEDEHDDKTLRMIFANEKAGEFTGLSPEEVVGRTLDENFPGLRELDVPRIYADVARTGQPRVLGTVRYGDERVREAEFSVKVFPLSGNNVGVLFENISDS